MSAGMIGRVLVSVDALALFSPLAAGLVSNGGGGFFSIGGLPGSCTPGAAEAAPNGGDFCGSDWPNKLQTQTKLTTARMESDLIIAQSTQTISLVQSAGPTSFSHKVHEV